MTNKYKNLTPKKQKFLSYLKILTAERPEPSEVAKEVGISLATYYRWADDEELLSIVKIERQREFEEGLTDVLDALLKKAVQGDNQAVKLYLAYMEKHHKLSMHTLTPDSLILFLKWKHMRKTGEIDT